MAQNVILWLSFINLNDFLHLCYLQYTINAKKVEVAVKKIISGEAIHYRGTLANPNSLDLYYNIPELALSNDWYEVKPSQRPFEPLFGQMPI